MERPVLVLIDGNSLAYRAYYALPELKTSRGFPTSALYGFMMMYSRIIKEYSPDYVVVAFDKEKKTLRHDLYGEYKGTRKATPPELRQQFAMLRELLGAANISFVEEAGYEADDIIGTLASRAEENDLECLIVTGDQDALQLVTERVRVILTRRGITDTEVYDCDKVVEKWEVLPPQLVDVKALMGDPSDNIPGVPSVGKKTAIKLIKEYGSLQDVYENLEKVGGSKLRQALEENRDQAFLSRQLASIITDVPVAPQWEEWRVAKPDYERLAELYRQLEFTSLLAELKDSMPSPEPVPVQLVSVPEFLERLDADGILAVYLKTDSPHPMRGEPEGIYFSNGQLATYISFTDDSWAEAGGLLSSGSRLYMHNAKFSQVMLERFGIKLPAVTEDTLLLSYCVNPSFSGESLSEHLLQYLGISVDEARNPDQAVAMIIPLVGALRRELEEQVASVYHDVEMPLSPVLARMELAGIKVDAEILRAQSEELEGRIDTLAREIYQLADGEFNINSPRQLGSVLFERLGLPARKKTKTGYSTSVEVLEELYEAHPIIAKIMEYRSLTKLKTTYVDALPGYINEETGRVHTLFKQAVTATGRLSSVEPNLQNIPIRSEEGVRVRRAFVAEAGKVLVSADYSQIDLRALAHMSKDANLIRAFREGVDIHALTASQIFKVPVGQVDTVLRRRAKAVNFGIVYGISDFGLARDTGVSRAEARRYIDQYLDSYPGVRAYMHDIMEFGRRHGYVETILGRRRYLPDLLSSNRNVRANAERMALNTPIQGTSADIIKLAMLEIDRRLQQEDFKARMLLQVHDELILEAPEEEVDRLVPMVRECMVQAYALDVPLEVSVEIGRNWYEMKEWE